jgi:hypothetical protein
MVFASIALQLLALPIVGDVMPSIARRIPACLFLLLRIIVLKFLFREGSTFFIIRIFYRQ